MCNDPIQISCIKTFPITRGGGRKETPGETPGQQRIKPGANRDSLALTRLDSKGPSKIGVLLDSAVIGTLRTDVDSDTRSLRQIREKTSSSIYLQRDIYLMKRIRRLTIRTVKGIRSGLAYFSF